MNRLLIYISIAALSFLGCATITTPMGGPQDKEAPILISSTPKNNEKNFKKETVQLTFNEDIKLKDPKEEIIITPSPGKDTEIKALGKTLTIKPKNGWEDNTTYSISFREGVQDITEGNPAEDLKLAFSTGPIIDSLIISGNIKDGLTEKIPEKITVAIYSADTFDIFKHTPVYFTKSSKEGNFKLENLKAGVYNLYAFDDKNKNLKVESQNEQFGFIADSIDLKTNKTKITIPLVKIDTRKLKLTKPRSTGEIAFIKFNKSILNYTLSTKESDSRLLHSFGDDQTEIKLLLQNQEKDSLLLSIKAVDSLSQKVDTTLFIKKGKNQKIDEKFNVEVSQPTLEAETGEFELSIKSNKLIESINTDSLVLELDSLTKITFKDKDFKWDTVHKKIELKTTIDKKLINPEGKISLLTGKDFIKTFENDSIKRSTKTINVLTIEETGTLTVDIKTSSTENFIVQLLSNDKVIKSVSNQKKHTFKYLEPASYKLRIIIDKNKNDKWDIGDYFIKQEPEKTIYYINREKKYETPMRANWESEITISF